MPRGRRPAPAPYPDSLLIVDALAAAMTADTMRNVHNTVRGQAELPDPNLFGIAPLDDRPLERRGFGPAADPLLVLSNHVTPVVDDIVEASVALRSYSGPKAAGRLSFGGIDEPVCGQVVA